jgi:hypothetical protein
VLALSIISRPKRRRATGVRSSWDTARTSSRCMPATLQVLGHAIERRRQAPDRVGAPAGTRVSRLPWAMREAAAPGRDAPLQLAHQQVDHQADQAQAEKGDQDQQLRRIRVELVQRADLQHPRRAGKPANTRIESPSLPSAITVSPSSTRRRWSSSSGALDPLQGDVEAEALAL